VKSGRNNHQSLILGLLLLCVGTGIAQPFEIGHTSMNFNDPDRNREIPTAIFYPASTAGVDAAIAQGHFPVIIFGHGFLMSYSAYSNFWEEFVPLGYILMFPLTEEGMSPDHLDLGLDLAFLEIAMESENVDDGSIFHGAVDDRSAVLGHSMGGGASVLAAQSNPSITTLVNFAAAETTPSCIAVAGEVTMPALIFSGSEDCVTLPELHQLPIYDSLASGTKTYINITGGGHCYFANTNLMCELAENLCSSGLQISRATQQDVTFDLLTLWLDHYLRDAEGALVQFNDSLRLSTRFDHLHTPELVEVNDVPVTGMGTAGLEMHPNPFNGSVMISYDTSLGQVIGCTIYDPSGRVVWSQTGAAMKDRTGLITWDGRSNSGDKLGTGLFIVSLQTEQALLTGKVLLIK